ncbi:MAG: M28 family peptidase [Flavobacteriaceae bacterium]|nr:M28 family peptidase [Flavobacteriaceae bacterium]
MKSKNYSLLITYIIIIATVFWSIYSLLPRNITTLDIPIEKFSTERALVHVKEISKKPHFVGAEAHEEVRNYIVSELQKLGLDVEIQQQVATNNKWRASATLHNILARIPGENNSEALMLLSHYDSSPHASLGASDAGSGVAAIIEGVRAFLSTNKKPKNDIIILISDGEELGLLGAKAFVKYHPWAKYVKLVLNFEARGSGGPSYMLLETNQGNKKFIEAFANANAPYPVSNSIAYSIYKSLPNDTDLTVFREDANIDGYNFAFIDDHFDYHTAQDSYERLDKNTLEHQGTYLMATLNYFSQESISDLKSDEDYIFFNISPFGLIYYPTSWIFPMLLIAFMFFGVLLFYGFKQDKLTVKNILKGFLPLLLSLISVGLFSFFGWKFIKILYPQYGDMINKFTYNGVFYIIAFSLFSVVGFLIIYQKFSKKNSLENLMIAPLIFWLFISLAVPFKIIGASYMVIPLLFVLISFGFILFNKKIKTPIWWHSLLAFPLMMLFIPFVYMLPVALGLEMLVASSILLVLILVLMLPIFYQNDYKLKIILLVAGILFLFKAHIDSGYNSDQRKPNSLIYIMNIEENKASWLSFDKKLDEFTKQYLSEEHPNNENKIFFKSKFDTSINYQLETKLLDLSTPTITVLSDSVFNYQRYLKILFQSNRKANKMEMIALNPLRVFSIKINGDEEKSNSDEPLFKVSKNRQVMSYYFHKSEPLEITLIVSSFEEFDVNIYETKFDLLNNDLIKTSPRTNIMMPKPYVTSDATIIVKRINFPTYEK